MTPHLVVGGENDGFKRFEAGLCALYPCPGRIMLYGMETKQYPFPDNWIKEEIVNRGAEVPSQVEVTTYAYKCLECGNESLSTEAIDTAVMN